MAAKAGDKDAWLQLLLLTPVADRTNPESGQPYPPMPDETLTCEYIYADDDSEAVMLDPDALAGIAEGLAQMDTRQGRPFVVFVAKARQATLL